MHVREEAFDGSGPAIGLTTLLYLFQGASEKLFTYVAYLMWIIDIVWILMNEVKLEIRVYWKDIFEIWDLSL